MLKEKRLMHGLQLSKISQPKLKDQSKSMTHSLIHKYILKVEALVQIL